MLVCGNVCKQIEENNNKLVNIMMDSIGLILVCIGKFCDGGILLFLSKKGREFWFLLDLVEKGVFSKIFG